MRPVDGEVSCKSISKKKKNHVFLVYYFKTTVATIIISPRTNLLAVSRNFSHRRFHISRNRFFFCFSSSSLNIIEIPMESPNNCEVAVCSYRRNIPTLLYYNNIIFILYFGMMTSRRSRCSQKRR